MAILLVGFEIGSAHAMPFTPFPALLGAKQGASLDLDQEVEL
jgi:hypothetical protein